MGYQQPTKLSAVSIAVKTGVQLASYTYAADAEASDAYAITLSPAVLAYQAGQEFVFKANTINTGAASLNVNGLGAKTIKKLHDQDLEDGDIEAGAIIKVIYDGTNFQLVSVGAIDRSSLTVFMNAEQGLSTTTGRGWNPSSLIFGNGVDEYSYFSCKVPAGATKINSIKVYYYATAEIGNLYIKFWTLLFKLSTVTLADQDQSYAAYSQAGTVTLQMYSITVPAACYNGLTPVNEGDILSVAINRGANNALDTYEADWKVLGVEVVFG